MVIVGQLKAIGMERDVCVNVWAHMCVHLYSQVTNLKKLSRLACVIFVPASPPPAHNLSVVTHMLSGFDLDSICFLS